MPPFPMRSLGALGYRDYQLFVVGNACSLVGSWTHRVAAGWLAWELTQSATWLGLIAFADLFPTLIFGPVSGLISDRFAKLNVVKTSQFIALVPAIGIVALSLTGLLDIWLLFAVTFLLGSAQAIEQPARLALVSDLVPREHMRSAVAINSIIFNLARFAGPALAGIIIAFSSSTLAFVFNVFSFLVFIALLGAISAAPIRDRPKRRGFGSEFAEGLKYIASNRGLYLVLMLIGALNLGARPILELLPAFSAEQFLSDATGFAILSSAVGAGAMMGGLGLMLFGAKWSNTSVAFASAIGVLTSSVVFIVLPWLWAGALCIAALGIFLATSGIAMQSMIQLSTASAMRGRVLSIYGMLFRAAPAIGGVSMGYLSELSGLRWSVAFGCVIIVSALVVASFRHKAIAGMETADAP